MPIVALPFTAGHRDLLSDLLSGLGADGHAALTLVASTAADITAHGLRFSPDIDAGLSLSSPASPAADGVIGELRAYGIDADWFDFDERSLVAALVRTRLLGLGYSPTHVTAAMGTRFGATHGVLPLSDHGLESHVVTEAAGASTAVHVRHAGAHPGTGRAVTSGLASAKAAPGVLGAIRKATTVLLLPPATPAWSEQVALRATLDMPGVSDALAGTRAHLLSPSPGDFSNAGIGAPIARIESAADVIRADERARRELARPSTGTVWDAS